MFRCRRSRSRARVVVGSAQTPGIDQDTKEVFADGGVLYSRRVFDPAKISDDACAEGHLDSDPIYGVLLALGQKLITGRLTIADAAGDNHMYFMQGRPVGVHLAEHFHPLGQLLLELGRMDGATFVRAQRLIAEGNRLPGQVYKELGILDDQSLQTVLSIQARRKAEHFCRLGSRAFTFCRGLTYLTGFTSTPLDPHAVIFLAVRQQMGEQSREGWLDAARTEQVRLVPPGGVPAEGAVVDNLGLPGPPANFGFGAPEERFLQRLLAGFESVVDLGETGTLPRDEMAVLLRYLEVIGRLQRRPIPIKRAPTPAPVVVQPPVQSFQAVQTPVQPYAPVSPHAVTSPKQVSAVLPRSPELDALQRAPLAEPTSDDVFSKPAPMAQRPAAPVVAAAPDLPWANPDAPTDPRRPAVTREELMAPLPMTPPPPRPSANEPMVFASAGTLGPVKLNSLNDALNDPTPVSQPSIVVSEDLPPPVVKKKKVKRSEPLPSEASGVLVSETRREKTMISELPSIVIDED